MSEVGVVVRSTEPALPLRSLRGLTSRQRAILAAPPVLVATTYLVFQTLIDWLGLRWGYLGGFLFFWIAWCLGFTLWAIGREGITAVLQQVGPALSRPTVLWLGFLAFPVAGGLVTVLLPALPDATVPVVGLALVIAAVNAFSEEVFWRGMFVRMFPGRKVLGWLYPAAWFSLWHISPTSVFGSTPMLVAGAHFLVNAMGLGFATLLLQP